MAESAPVTPLRFMLQVKFAWKIQRDMAERGHSLESIKASIEARKPDFDAFIDPQKQKADVIIQVSYTLLSSETLLRLRLGQALMQSGLQLGRTMSWSLF